MRGLVTAFIGGDLSPPSDNMLKRRIRRQVAENQSGDLSPHRPGMVPYFACQTARSCSIQGSSMVHHL
ncbi:MAG: hypothetical protein K1Y36_24600 [Blastocatellia bacterium]|nr:hypothetical protein [Blastocatellia bacterium]